MPRWLGHLVGAGLLAATLLNGLGAYAKRVGAIERQAYEHYWVLRCGVGGVSERWFGLGRRCAVPEPLEGYTMRQPPLAAYVFAVQGYEWPTKAAKDAVMLGLAAIGAVVTLRDPSRRLHFRHAALPALLAAYVLLWALVTAARGDVLLALVGLRSFSFLFVALLWMSAVSSACLATVASWCVGLLCVQAVLIPWEVLRGVTDRPTLWLSIRTAGTLVNANTLGIVAVTAMAFVLSYGRPSRWNAIPWAITVALVACAGSGAGWLILAVVGSAHVAQRVPVSGLTRLLAIVAVALLCLAALSFLTGRGDVLHSVAVGRLGILERLLRQDGLTVVVGNGLGVGTNAATAVLGRFSSPMDSTVTVVLKQVGIVGVILFYASLLQSWHGQRKAGAFLLAALMASVAANILEVFPVNALVALSMAAGLRGARSADDARA